ncbi:hypothetical protein B9Z47_18225, partial [Limnohabitans sp. 2KL-1]|uniref:Ig-like domain-containing protein n=1 Tax=Limnohabitans sp. 2KL-1 TaxID=1100699 RepID=UPI000DD1ECD6
DLVFQAAANASGNNYANFKFKVMDSRVGNNEDLVPNTLTFNVAPVNDAPILADTSLNLSAVIQGSAVPAGAVGVLVSTLVGGVTDIDAGAVKGIAITGFNSAKGQLYFSTNGGTNWTEITSASEASARLLKADTDNRVYFKAAAGTQGTVADALTFRAWDSTTGTDGLTGNTTTNGGTTAFSTTTDTVSDYVVAPVTINVVSADDLVNPKETLLISGKADPNAVVTLNINSQNINVTANATGDWSYDGSKVRYVMVRKTLQNLAETDPNFAANGVMTIGDVTVMSGGTNVAITATQTTSNRASFQYTGGAYYDKSIHDGSVAENSFAEAYGFAVPGGAGGDVWVQLDLGDWYSVDSIDVRARNNLGTRANGTKVYVSTDDMSALSTVQLNAAVNVGAPSTVSGMTNVGSTTYQIVETVATYANSLLAGPNTITASELVQGVSSQATRVVTLDNLAPVTTVTSAALSSDTGTSNTDFITSVAAQTITGNLSANLATGEQVMVSLDNGLTWTVATATVGTSTWSLPGVTLLGTDTLQAKVVDTAGNGSTPYTKVYALVTVSDLTVGITQIDDNAGTPSTVLSGGTTNDTTPQLLGTLGGATQGAALGTNEVVNVYRTPNLAVATVVQAGTLAGDQILSGNALTYYNNGN